MTDQAKEKAPQTPTQGAGDKRVELSADQAAQVVQPAAAAVKQSWLTAAIGLANSIRMGKPVSPGGFEDVKRLREQFEELERARIVLQGISTAKQKPDA